MRNLNPHFLLLLLNLVLLGMISCSSDNVSAKDTEPEQEPFKYEYVVNKNGEGDFTSVQEAIDAVQPYLDVRTYILIKNGSYKEELNIPVEKKNITLVGESVENVVITYDNAANKTDPETGEKYGTSGSASVYIHGEGFVAKNITFENSAGYYSGRKGRTDQGQTLAIYIDGKQSIFDNCRFLSGQDTFYAGRDRSYIKNSYIEGTTDFIFGPATIVFKNCEIHSYGGTAITAANTESFVDYGFVFQNCRVTAESGVETTLGRPWRGYAAVAFLNSTLGDCIMPEGWTNWHDTDRYKTARYYEYNNAGAGANLKGRIDWLHIIQSSSEAQKFKTENVLKTTYDKSPSVDNWDPEEMLQNIDDKIQEK